MMNHEYQPHVHVCSDFEGLRVIELLHFCELVLVPHILQNK